MLVAQNSKGEVISLTSNWSREALFSLRNDEEFFHCPSCKQRVQMKIGTMKIPHFAHMSKTICDSFSEGESQYHLKGKLQLYDWFVRQGYSPIIEPYFSQMKQRPDLYVEIKNQRYMIEYQCATIEKGRFQERNDNYLRHHYKVLWILGANRLKRISQNRFSITSFDWQFVKILHSRPTLLYYCSQTERFLFLHNIIPLHGNTVYANFDIQTPNAYFITNHINKMELSNSFALEWLHVKRNWRLTSANTKSPQTRKLLLFLYQKKIYPSLLPSEVGIPLPSMFWIQTPAIIWQAWILIDFIGNMDISFSFSYNEAYEYFNKRAKGDHFIIRHLPFIENSHYSFAIMEYLNSLVTLGILSCKNKSTFIKRRNVQFPINIEEALQSDEEKLKALSKKIKDYDFVSRSIYERKK
ncbi:competence protein CoiA [Bacillus suaedaesalsae]|uniref:Competence protein CoiA n=1 Tax=Bacillus suaedaesalsae TaxID=2810349 RepID=A0ABS2DIQ4_9BACI|nr:competence protein CoiA family protein [Bacillus suaedaesalsae]MBM6618271.1 hypothetical protein [Bacillus suaedaesalsae]